MRTLAVLFLIGSMAFPDKIFHLKFPLKLVGSTLKHTNLYVICPPGYRYQFNGDKLFDETKFFYRPDLPPGEFTYRIEFYKNNSNNAEFTSVFKVQAGEAQLIGLQSARFFKNVDANKPERDRRLGYLILSAEESKLPEGYASLLFLAPPDSKVFLDGVESDRRYDLRLDNKTDATKTIAFFDGKVSDKVTVNFKRGETVIVGYGNLGLKFDNLRPTLEEDRDYQLPSKDNEKKEE